MIQLNDAQSTLLDAFVAANADKPSFERAELFKFAEEQGFTGSSAYTLMKKMPRVARGVCQMIGSGNVVQMYLRSLSLICFTQCMLPVYLVTVRL